MKKFKDWCKKPKPKFSYGIIVLLHFIMAVIFLSGINNYFKEMVFSNETITPELLFRFTSEFFIIYLLFFLLIVATIPKKYKQYEEDYMKQWNERNEVENEGKIYKQENN